MGTAYGLSNCVGWFKAGVGCYSDAGSTAAASGTGVYQWNDQSGAGNHLQQTYGPQQAILNTYTAAVTANGAAALGPYGTTASVDQTSFAPSLLFDGSSSYMKLPTSATFSPIGFTALVCARGPYYAPLCVGSAAGAFINYGWVGKGPQKMGAQTAALNLFPLTTYVPAITPMVTGLRCSATLNETRVYLGATQSTAIGTHLANFNMAGGSVGATAPLNDPNYSYFWFRGEMYEVLFFNTPLDDAQIAALIQQMQAANGLAANANSSQVIFVGDSLTAGGPGIRPLSHCYAWQLARQYGGAVKPLLLAIPGETIAQQQALVTQQVIPLDRTAFAVNVAIVCCGRNHLNESRTAAQVSTDLAALCLSLKSNGYKVIVVTITPRSTAGFTAGMATALAAVNTTIRAGYTAYADAMVDWAIDSRLSDPTNTQYFADLCHTTDAGDNVKAQLVKAVLDPLLSPPTAVLSFAEFYSGGQNFAGNYGTFVRA